MIPFTLLLIFIILGGGIFLYKVPNPISEDIGNYYKILSGSQAEDLYDYNQYGLNSSIDTWNKTNRVHIWSSSIDVFNENMLFGVGTGDINIELNRHYILNGHNYLALKNTNTHNQYLDYLIKYGLVGFFLIFGAFVLYFRKAWENKDSMYLMFLLLISLCMLTENILNRQYGIVFFFLFNSLFYLRKSNSTISSR